MMHPETDVDPLEQGDKQELADHDPFQPREAAIERETLRKRDAEQHERWCCDQGKGCVKAGEDRLKNALASEQPSRAAAATDVGCKAEQQHEQQPGRAVGDAHCSHPETEHDADDRQRDYSQREVGGATGSAGVAAIRPQLDRKIPNRIVGRGRRLDPHPQPIADPRVAQRAVVNEEPVDRTAVHREHGVAGLHSFGLGLRLDILDAPVRVAKIERPADVLARVPHRIEAVERVACEMRDREEKQRGEADVRDRVRSHCQNPLIKYVRSTFSAWVGARIVV